MTLGEMVSEYRQSHGLSMRDFARRCGVSHVVVQYVEKGERQNGEPYMPKFDTVRKLARGMGKTAEELISECEDFDLDISVGSEESPIYADFLSSQSTDEMMMLQAYRMIPIEHRIEAMQAIFKIREKYEN